MNTQYELLNYIAKIASMDEENQSVPSLNVISTELGVSVARLREQLEVAKALGFVEVKPRTGIRIIKQAFSSALDLALAFFIQTDNKYFDSYADLRKKVESAYFIQAVKLLDETDFEHIFKLIGHAINKLEGKPIRIPHDEHRKLHLYIYNKLDNPFVTGVLEAYWNAYEQVGLTIFSDYEYYKKVWQYHQSMMEAVVQTKYDEGFNLFIEHTDLIRHRDQD